MKPNGRGLALNFVCVVFGLVTALTSSAQGTAPGACRALLAKGPDRSVIHAFRIGTLNLFNFNSSKKPEAHRLMLAEAILSNDLDVIAIQEIRDADALREFSSKYLGNRYAPLLLAGNKNDQNIGFLVRRNTRLQAKLTTNTAETWTNPVSGTLEPLFARDFAVLHLIDSETRRPLARIGGIHLKSKVVREGQPESSVHRRSEIERILSLWSHSNPNVPDLILGDSNGTPDEDREIRHLHESGFVDVLTARPPTEGKPKHTHIYFPRGEDPRFQKLDLIAVRNLGQQNGPRITLNDAYVNEYRDENGQVLSATPATFQELQALPSDHLLVVAEFDLDPKAE